MILLQSRSPLGLGWAAGCHGATTATPIPRRTTTRDGDDDDAGDDYDDYWFSTGTRALVARTRTQTHTRDTHTLAQPLTHTHSRAWRSDVRTRIPTRCWRALRCSTRNTNTHTWRIASCAQAQHNRSGNPDRATRARARTHMAYTHTNTRYTHTNTLDSRPCAQCQPAWCDRRSRPPSRR